RFRRRQTSLPQNYFDDRRGRGRQPHPHVATYFLFPAHERAYRPRAHLHRAAAALSREARQNGKIHSRRTRLRARVNETRHGRSRREGQGRCDVAGRGPDFLSAQRAGIRGGRRKTRTAAERTEAGGSARGERPGQEDGLRRKEVRRETLERHRKSKTEARRKSRL